MSRSQPARNPIKLEDGVGTARRVVLTALTLSGLYTGGWATVLPRSFYDSFPGLGRAWVAVEGPYNEHLARDVGAFYLALAAVGVAAAVSRRAEGYRFAGLGWAFFSLPHVAYHSRHLSQLPLLDRLGNELTLGITLVGALYLLLPLRRAASAPSASDP